MAVRSHKMPKAYLKRFAEAPMKGKRYGRLCVYERGKEPRAGTAHSEAAERGFFTSRSEDGTLEDSTTENWAQTIEDGALNILTYASSPIFVWTRETRRQMAEYWALMFLRSTSFYDFHKNGSEEVFSAQMRRLSSDEEFRQKLVSHYSLLLGRPIPEEELFGAIGRAVTALLTKEELRNQYVQQLKRRVELFSGILLKKPWQIWTAPDSREFVTCDSPVMTFRVDQWNRYSVGDGFAKEGVIALLPISSGACLLAGQQGCASKEIGRADTHEVNKIIIAASARFVYSRTRDSEIDALVQEFAGTVRYGVNAFKVKDNFDNLFF